MLVLVATDNSIVENGGIKVHEIARVMNTECISIIAARNDSALMLNHIISDAAVCRS